MLATGNKSLTDHRLSIRLGADGFSFFVLNAFDGSTVQADRFPVGDASVAVETLRNALRKPYLMDYRFQGVELEVDGPATIVPLDQFNKSDMMAFYRLCFPTAAGDLSGGQCSLSDMQYQILSPVEAVMIFRLDQDLLRTVQECYPDVKVCCADARQLEHFAALQEKRPAPEDEMQCDAYLTVGRQSFFFAAFRRSRLIYAASQPADNDADRTFLLLGIWKALGLQPQRDVCHLEDASEELQRTIGEYILNTD